MNDLDCIKKGFCQVGEITAPLQKPLEANNLVSKALG